MNQVTPFTQITPELFKTLLETGEYILLDVRTEREVQLYGEIPGTKARYDIYEPDFIEKVLSLPRDQKYLLYCWHGSRTQQAREWMKEHGFTWVCDLKGGIDKWNF